MFSRLSSNGSPIAERTAPLTASTVPPPVNIGTTARRRVAERLVAFGRTVAHRPALDAEAGREPVERVAGRVVDPVRFEQRLERLVGVHQLGADRVEQHVEQRAGVGGGVRVGEERGEPVGLERHALGPVRVRGRGAEGGVRGGRDHEVELRLLRGGVERARGRPP